MDNNIKLLAEQALAFAYETCKELGHKIGPVDQIFVASVMGKYTELIVQECGSIADEFCDEHLRTKPSDRLKEHFGVE